MIVVIHNLGCKVNQYEADSIARELTKSGHSVSFDFIAADVYIINSCAVTAEAERKSRQMTAKSHKLNANAAVIVCGCASENNAFQFDNKDGVIYIGGASGKSDIPRIINALEKSLSSEYVHNPLKIGVKPLPTQYEDDLAIDNCRTRAYVKVQDGCNNYCSYCIIPYLRGRSRSRTVESAAAEIAGLSKAAREIVVTGINLSAYGTDIGSSLTQLISALGDIDARIRLGSLEVNVIDDKFLLATQELRQFCPQFHLSLQSGDNEVLKAMNRHYTVDEYADKVALIRRYYPDAAITTDLICAYPTETEEQFNNTLSFIEKIGFSDIHVFVYSPRSGTKAAKLKAIEPAIAKERASRADSIANQMKRKYLQSHINKPLEVLIEDDNCGYSREYIRVYASGNDGEIITVAPQQLYLDGLI